MPSHGTVGTPGIQKRKRPIRRWDPQDVVTLFAGNEESEKPLNVHKEVACYYSPVFRAAFSSRFVEGLTQTYRLEEASEKTVRMLIHWMYNQDIDIGQVSRNTKTKTDQFLVEFWVLADKLLIPSLQNAIMVDLENLRTAEDSPLRSWFLHHCAFNVVSTRFAERPQHFPQEMLLELAQTLIDNMPDDFRKERAAHRTIGDFEVEVEEEDEENAD